MPTYEINVAYKGRHYCKITLPLGLTKAEAIARTISIQARFLPAADYKLNLTAWEKTGQPIGLDSLD